MRYTEKDRVEMERIAKAAVKRGRKLPDYCKPRPDLRGDLLFYYTAYVELVGNGFNFSECRDYASWYGVSLEKLRYILRVMHNNRNA